MGMGMGTVLLLALKQHSCPRHYTAKKSPLEVKWERSAKGPLSLSRHRKSKKMKMYPLEKQLNPPTFFEISPDLGEKTHLFVTLCHKTHTAPSCSSRERMTNKTKTHPKYLNSRQ